MTRIEASTVIHAPADLVFAAVTDPRRTTEWNPNIMEVSEASPLPPQEGTSWTQVALLAGRRVKLSCKIVRFQPPVEGDLEVSGDQRARIRTVCRPDAAGTVVTQTIDFTPPAGILGRMAAQVMGNALRHEMERTLERQRETLEREARSG